MPSSPRGPVLYWGFTTHDLSEAVQAALRPEDLWIGKNVRCQYSIIDFLEFRLERLTLPVPLQQSELTFGPELTQSIYATMQRELIGWQTGQVEKQQLLRFYQRWFVTLLKHYQIQQIWFAYIPHEGASLIIYAVAQALGIRTRMFYQSLMVNRTFLIERIEDMGKLPQHAGQWRPFADTITFGKPEQDLFYMRTLPPVVSQLRFGWRSFWPRLKAKLRGKIAHIGVIAIAARLAQRRQWLAMQARMQWDSTESFANKAFVYVPLHLQPELTTDPLGGKYGDQALFIEMLRLKLPPDIAIVIKENPKQEFESRSQFFWQRLRRLPETYVVDPGVNTYFLLHQSAAVATITGTAGWEGVLAGKPVVVGGAAWYQDLPGVWQLDELPEWQNLMKFKADFTLTRNALDCLASSMPEVVADPDYQTIHPEYESHANQLKLREILQS